MQKEITGPQVAFGKLQIWGQRNKLLNYAARSRGARIREVRKHPTVRLARALSTAPILMAPWSVEAEDGAPDGAKELINKYLIPLRAHILRHALNGCIDWGYAPFEKVFDVDDKDQIYPRKIKPLLQDYTSILTDTNTGAFTGFEQTKLDGTLVDLDIDSSLLLNMEIEGTDWNGVATLDCVEPIVAKWEDVDAVATRYDKKVAGVNRVIHYPPGKSVKDGVEVSNFEIATGIMQQLGGGGDVAVPRTVSDTIDDMTRDSPDAWKFDKLADQGATTTFIERMAYLDALIVRAFMLPERAVLEGQYGTKAEAEVHVDLGLVGMQAGHEFLVQQINWHLVNQLLRLNWGRQAENKVYVKATPLVDAAKQVLKEIYMRIIQGDAGLLAELETIDTEALKDKLGIPIAPEQEQDAPGIGDQSQGVNVQTDGEIQAEEGA